MDPEKILEVADSLQAVPHSAHATTSPKIRENVIIVSSPESASTSSASTVVAAPPNAESVLALIRSAYDLWRDSPTVQSLPSSSFHVRPLTGGSSNSLWLASIDSAALKKIEADVIAASSASWIESIPPPAVVVRFYGAATSAFIERDTEALVAELLSSAGIGARIYTSFTEPLRGRIEQFVAGRTLLHHELAHAHIGVPIVRELARLHMIDVPQDEKYRVIPRTPQLFENMHKWFRLAIDARKNIPSTPAAAASASSSTSDDIYSLSYQNSLYSALNMPSSLHDASNTYWRDEITWLQGLLEGWHDLNEVEKSGGDEKQFAYLRDCIKLSNVALCHNDLNPGNILYVEQASDHHHHASPAASSATSSIPSSSTIAPLNPFTLIDFEYSAYNHPQYDLANHLCEYALDYTVKDYPMFQFMHEKYAVRQKEMMGLMKEYERERKCDDAATAASSSSTFASADASSSVCHLYLSTLTYTLASHLLWSFWSIIQSSSLSYSTHDAPSWSRQPNGDESLKPPPLAYLEYAQQRMEMYQKVKQLWVKVIDGTANSTTSGALPGRVEWTQFRSNEDWLGVCQRVEKLHEAIRAIKLDSAEQQRQAYQRYQKACCEAKNKKQQAM